MVPKTSLDVIYGYVFRISINNIKIDFCKYYVKVDTRNDWILFYICLFSISRYKTTRNYQLLLCETFL
jgi:hypothetical protein